MSRARSGKRWARKVVPEAVHAWLRSRGLTVWPPVGRVRLGGLRRPAPFSRSFGFDRGQPIDRWYIERFLERHGGPSGDIRGRVLEVGNDTYTVRFGPGPPIVQAVDVVDADPSNSRATLVADLAHADGLEGDRFDCIICTQTLLFIEDVRAAIGHLGRLLKPGGVLLVTVPGISQICHPEMERWGDYWRFTSRSAAVLFAEVFPSANVEVETFGNVLTASAFLYGLCAADLRRNELAHHDPDYQLIIGVRATKPGTS